MSFAYICRQESSLTADSDSSVSASALDAPKIQNVVVDFLFFLLLILVEFGAERAQPLVAARLHPQRRVEFVTHGHVVVAPSVIRVVGGVVAVQVMQVTTFG